MNPVASPRRPFTRGKVRGGAAFTLIELLVVLAIIGILAALTVPAFRGLGRGNARNSGERQLLSDLSLARQFALRNRATVYMVFVPPRTSDTPFRRPGVPETRTYRQAYDEHETELNRLANQLRGNSSLSGLGERLRRSYTNAVLGQYTSYALYTERAVGDQPGTGRPRYLTEWRSLPDGIVFSHDMFVGNIFGPAPDLSPALPSRPQTNLFGKFTRSFPFPTVIEPGVVGPEMMLPYIAFEPDGRISYPGLAVTPDFYVAVAEGSVQIPRDAKGTFDLKAEPDLIEAPARNHTNSFIRIAAATGRARLEKPRLE